MTRYTPLLCLCILTLLPSCGSSTSETARTTADTSARTPHPNVSVLTTAQVQTVGIELGQIAQRNLSSTIHAYGMLRVPSNGRARAASLYGGIVSTLDLHVGDRVRRGQTVAMISSPQFVTLQEEYLTLTERILQAEQELERQRTLAQGNAGTGRNLQSAETSLRTLTAQRSAISEQLRLIGIAPSSVTASRLRSSIAVTSPITGVVSEIYATLGSYVDGNSPVLEVVDNETLHLDLQVFERDLPHVRVGQSVQFALTNNSTRNYQARVYNIGATFEGDTKSISVHCDIEGDKTGLIDGMNITGYILTDTLAVAAVPDEAIVESEGKYYIYTLLGEESEHQSAGHPLEHSHSSGVTHAHPHQHPDGDESRHDHPVTFQRVEVARGASQLGYTAIIPVEPVAPNAPVVIRGAYFVHATFAPQAGHDH